MSPCSTAGLEVVLGAVELVLKSAEHMRNELAELTAHAALKQARTTLEVSEPPQHHSASPPCYQI